MLPHLLRKSASVATIAIAACSILGAAAPSAGAVELGPENAPQGTVYDKTAYDAAVAGGSSAAAAKTASRLAGASVELYVFVELGYRKVDSVSAPFVGLLPDANPQATDVDGTWLWTTQYAGTFHAVVSKTGCTTTTSADFTTFGFAGIQNVEVFIPCPKPVVVPPDVAPPVVVPPVDPAPVVVPPVDPAPTTPTTPAGEPPASPTTPASVVPAPATAPAAVQEIAAAPGSALQLGPRPTRPRIRTAGGGIAVSSDGSYSFPLACAAGDRAVISVRSRVRLVSPIGLEHEPGLLLDRITYTVPRNGRVVIVGSLNPRALAFLRTHRKLPVTLTIRTTRGHRSRIDQLTVVLNRPLPGR